VSRTKKCKVPPLSAEDRQHLGEFSELRALVRARTESVARQFQTGCYIAGRPGTSKTFTVVETLRALKVPWQLYNAHMTPIGLFRSLQRFPNQVFVVDDLPEVYSGGNKNFLQILLAALGGEPGTHRTITYITNSVAESVEFSGGIIAIGNAFPKRNPMADAFMSRVCPLAHAPSDAMLAAFMRAEARKGSGQLAPAERLEVAEFVIAESHNADYRLDLRTFSAALRDYAFCKTAREYNWQDLVRSSLKKAAFGNHPVVTRAERLVRERDIAVRIRRLYPQRSQKAQRDGAWRQETGLSPHTLYRHLREAG
jgi:hypothetical protein